MDTHGIEDNFENQNDVNPDNSKSLKLNIIDNTNVKVAASSRNNIYNIGVRTSSSSSSSNSFDNYDFYECLRNKEEAEGNETDFSLYEMPVEYLF